MSSIAVIGAGAWGTALAIHAARRGHAVTLWARDPASILGESPRLPGVTLPHTIRVTGTLAEADATLVAVPMQHLRAVLAALRPRGMLVLCCKGIESATLRLPLEVAREVLPDTAAMVLTGPNFAREVAKGMPAAAVIAGADTAARQVMAGLLGGPSFRLYGNADAVGAQIGGAAKNVVAVAAGAVIGAGLGENARAGLITRGLAEMSRLAVALGGQAETVAGLAGMGDLVLTCTGTQSRNFSLGIALGRGGMLWEIAPEGGPVVEAIATAPALLARAGPLELPICQAVAELLAGRADVTALMARLMGRPNRDE
jgi:glycerol-3-phosphate dehydrogenase (NAD(P)+)